jgi:peptidoglycan/xylan/chitin deacetylase (PgdA/CDA1 family)
MYYKKSLQLSTVKSFLTNKIKSSLLYFNFNQSLHHIKVAILMYHRIHCSSYLSFNPSKILEVSPDLFEKQIQFFSNNYDCISMDDLICSINSNRLNKPAIVITFDDGYSDNLKYALPVLEKYNVPATIYITTLFIENRLCPWWFEIEQIINDLDELSIECNGINVDYQLYNQKEKTKSFFEINQFIRQLSETDRKDMMERIKDKYNIELKPNSLMLSWQELSVLSKSPLVTIGAHTQSHANLSKCKINELENEIIGSKQILEKKIDKPVRHFAYPYGDKCNCNNREFAFAKKSGFISGVTTIPGLVDIKNIDVMCLPRIPITSYDTIPRLRWMLRKV